ncbi:MAG: hypothetical protein F4213_14850 [Boseongicola sp. SB0677_bin_26]|nr:hypothetical protein [Boseongicola sp. SB0665_bin_10]MYG27279.1 hypothetical protein [Boseongicola sp. SB0677_bin_26]
MGNDVKEDAAFSVGGAVTLGTVGYVVCSSVGVAMLGTAYSGEWFGAVTGAVIGALLGYVLLSIRRRWKASRARKAS